MYPDEGLIMTNSQTDDEEEIIPVKPNDVGSDKIR